MEEQPPEAVILNQGTNSNRNIGAGTASHLCGSLLALVITPVAVWIVPLILYSTNDSEDAVLKHHLAQSLNASATFSIAFIIHFVLMWVCLGFITVAAHWIMYVIWSVNANNALKAGQMYDYPFTINIVSP